MDCLEFRRRLVAEPHSRDQDFLAHRDGCRAGCTESWWRAQRLERHIEGALQSVEPPANLAERVLLAQATASRGELRARWRRRIGLALAALLVIALLAAGYAWNLRGPGDRLPAMAIAHLGNGEAYSLTLTAPVGNEQMRKVFAGRGIDLRAMPPHAVYAHDCMVGPYRALHLVLREGGKPVVALYVLGTHVARASDFERSGWHGREVPMGDGTLVLLGTGTRGFAAAERAVALALLGPGRQTLGLS
jgi:Protein of unknown function (DUF3379)